MTDKHAFAIHAGSREPAPPAAASNGPLEPEILTIVRALARHAAREEYQRLAASGAAPRS